MTAVRTMTWDAGSGSWQWVGVMSETFAPLDFRPLEEPVTATVSLRDLGAARLIDLVTSAASFVRSEREIDLGMPPSVLFAFPIQGQVHVEQMGRSATLLPGDAGVMSLEHPALARFSPGCHGVSVEIPRNLVPFSTPELVEIVATALHGELVEATVALIQSLIATCSEITFEQGADCGTALVCLAVALVRRLRAERSDAEPGMLDRVKLYVDRHLGDPALSPPVVAQGMHTSVRFLHRLFQAEPETVTVYIRRRRLEGIREDLANPELARLSVSEVAARWGLTDASRFGQLFRQTFGEAPSRYRRRHLATCIDPQRGEARRAPARTRQDNPFSA